MRSSKLVVVSLAILATTACSNMLNSTSVTRSVTSAIAYTDTGVSEPDKFPVLRAVGYASISAQKGPSRNQKNLQAMRASKVDAYRELTEQVYGIYVDSNEKQINQVQREDQLRSQVSGVVHGARVIRQYPSGDSYVTELELDTKVVYQMYQMRGAL